MLFCLTFTLEVLIQRFLCLGVNLRTVQKIQKELDKSIDDYEGMAALKPHFVHFNKKKNSQICYLDPGHD